MFINARTTLTIHVREKKEIRMQRNESSFFLIFFIYFINSSINMICGGFFMHVRLDKYTNINLKLYFFSEMFMHIKVRCHLLQNDVPFAYQREKE